LLFFSPAELAAARLFSMPPSKRRLSPPDFAAAAVFVFAFDGIFFDYSSRHTTLLPVFITPIFSSLMFSSIIYDFRHFR